uniref:Uncharacterized protein n=1 Tax=Anopheles darlingi TaxID=43151 RepID=A0A2M4CXK0_ANODA
MVITGWWTTMLFLLLLMVVFVVVLLVLGLLLLFFGWVFASGAVRVRVLVCFLLLFCLGCRLPVGWLLLLMLLRGFVFFPVLPWLRLFWLGWFSGGLVLLQCGRFRVWRLYLVDPLPLIPRGLLLRFESNLVFLVGLALWGCCLLLGWVAFGSLLLSRCRGASGFLLLVGGPGCLRARIPACLLLLRVAVLVITSTRTSTEIINGGGGRICEDRFIMDRCRDC